MKKTKSRYVSPFGNISWLTMDELDDAKRDSQPSLAHNHTIDSNHVYSAKVPNYYNATNWAPYGPATSNLDCPPGAACVNGQCMPTYSHYRMTGSAYHVGTGGFPVDPNPPKVYKYYKLSENNTLHVTYFNGDYTILNVKIGAKYIFTEVEDVKLISMVPEGHVLFTRHTPGKVIQVVIPIQERLLEMCKSEDPELVDMGHDLILQDIKEYDEKHKE